MNGSQDTEPAPLSHLLSQHLIPTLHLHLLPKSTLDIHLLILQSDTLPNVLATSLTVATAALADAGIPMSALGIGAVASLEEGGKVVIDPQEGESGSGGGVLGLGVMPALGKITGVWMSGEVEVDEVCLVCRVSSE
jgi:exosome complex component MTR3